MESNITTGLYLDTRRQRKDGLFPVKLRVTYQRESKFYRIPRFAYTETDYDKIIGKKTREEFKEIKLQLTKIEEEARKIIKELPVFSFKSFERRFLGKGVQYKDVFESYEYHIALLKKEGRMNTLFTYQAALKNLKEFHKEDKLLFNHVNSEYLHDFETYLKKDKKRKLSANTVSIYMRTLMHLFKLGIELKDIPENAYPFGKDKYELPEHHNAKRALSKKDVYKIINHPCKIRSMEHFYRDIWAFSYYANGMNLNDIFRLKYSNIQNNVITYIRKKVEHHKKTVELKAFIRPELKKIIDFWGQKPITKDTYIFNILTDGLTAEQEHKKIHQATKLCNKYIKAIAEDEKINFHVTSYVTRHSAATILRNSGESIAFISKALGHTNTETTANYLAQFDNKAIEKASKKL